MKALSEWLNEVKQCLNDLDRSDLINRVYPDSGWIQFMCSNQTPQKAAELIIDREAKIGKMHGVQVDPVTYSEDQIRNLEACGTQVFVVYCSEFSNKRWFVRLTDQDDTDYLGRGYYLNDAINEAIDKMQGRKNET